MGHRVVVANGIEGFRLSKNACGRLLELGLSKRELGRRNRDSWLDHRHDPRLIQVVDEMGNLTCQEEHSWAHSRLSDREIEELSIVDIDGNQYWIFDSYQGIEYVWEPKEVTWTTIDSAQGADD